jgi:hypothetical protein
MSEEPLTRTARHRSGLRRAVSRASPSSVKSRSGGPPTRSTGRTTDPQEQDNCRPRPPSGNTTSTEVLRTAATTSVGRMPKPASLPENIAATKINNAYPSPLPPARARRPALAGRSAVSLLLRAPCREVAFFPAHRPRMLPWMTARGRGPHFWGMTSHLSSVSPQSLLVIHR